MDYAKESLRLHGEWKGKIEVVAKVPVETKDDLSLAYTPGVAQPCLEIQKDIEKSYDLTRRHNMCLVVTDGSAVLGLGDIGPEAGMPVMEGKCVLFKAFGDVDAFPLCIKSKDVDEIVNTIWLISGSFGGVNLEDISAPLSLSAVPRCQCIFITFYQAPSAPICCFSFSLVSSTFILDSTRVIARLISMGSHRYIK